MNGSIKSYGMFNIPKKLVNLNRKKYSTALNCTINTIIPAGKLALKIWAYAFIPLLSN